MSLTGTEIKTKLLGDAVVLKDATEYGLKVQDIKVSVVYEYDVTPVDAQDNGKRTFPATVRLTASELSASLTKAQRQALVDLVESRIRPAS